MQLAMHGVVKSSAGMEDGSNGWWKGSTLKAKDQGRPETDPGEMQNVPKGDWLCQSYHCPGDKGAKVVNFKKNKKCFVCGASRRDNPI